MTLRSRPALLCAAVALVVIIGTACQPAKKPPPQPGAAPPGVNPCIEAIVLITLAQLCGWELLGSGGATTSFATGPAGVPFGSGSGRYDVGSDGTDFSSFARRDFTGLALADITELTYSTFNESGGSGGQAPYIILNIDHDGDGVADDRLFFEPVYQSGAYGIHPDDGGAVPDQCGGNPDCVVVGAWQLWNALIGGWWSLDDATFGPPLRTLAGYIADHPDATLLSDSTRAAVRITSGGGAGAWDDFVGYADGFNLNGTTYNFEA